ncbi:MAG: DMT family transporter [Bacteroidetes bacterium]|nr:DMT family transporter [Bacteroidota bacterium]
MRSLPTILPMSTGAKSMLLATFYFAIMNIFIKAVSHLPAIEIVFFRCGVSLLICFYQLKKEQLDWKGTNRKLLILRGVLGTIALYTYFITISKMPLGTAVIIQYLSPIFTTILAIFILKEYVKPIQWLFFIISFAGVFLMKEFDERIELTYLLIGLFSAITSAFVYITIRSLKEKEHPLIVVFHFQLIGTLSGMVFSVPVFEMPAGIEWLYLLIIGIFTQLGQLNMTRALQQDRVANVSIINYTGVIYAIAAGFLLFGEHYGWGTLAGIGLVLAGVVMSMIIK